ncbi:hypothetical protein TNCT_268051 [Trichonephila clavata]|uniref:Sm domain-containing protein n=1 Tax=Trichonephila clavata TaxID=2740835 RepID=A0A8X6JIB7_TRICU|nr:hypothetical protein TNCT_268051 [Trichonephila clavata]
MSATINSVPIVNPRPFLRSLVGKWVIMKLKWGLTLKGRLVISDQYVNIQLEFVEIYDGETLLSHTHTILIRSGLKIYGYIPYAIKLQLHWCICLQNCVMSKC